ncbi:DUF6241 domain-containing protein [Clostridium sp. AL.422]|uniref:DUF6241 domain-containing protein n=1 Tax=Clostridium TaxID=1485 RepID=UPI00293DA760|nr:MULTISPECIES: DUF6241 domain-containing protein [unclassified Clostridium]MDV4149414.1 DUF6241 domain-containing protein [Clostridium sp. AL.422]
MKNLFKSKIFITILVIILIIAIGTFSFLLYKQIDSGNLSAKSNISDIEKIDKELSSEDSTEIKDSDYYPIENIYDIIHRMSNTKIIAEDNQIWGKIEMDSEYIASLKSLIEKIDYEDKDYMLEVLTRWENNDFSQAVDEHNYFWKKLGGTVGKATSLKE